ncbi:uncharacterized protein [Miscanthus floridulus]|uniref:uncharacterized protein isoform X2 n=1 Tax=Miscanthus floridulus TaxID=154761 RepID=UPI00345A0547
MTYYGDKAKPRAYAARFTSPDRDELISVVIKPSNQLKITFLEAKDITDLGTLKEASKIFVPGSKLSQGEIKYKAQSSFLQVIAPAASTSISSISSILALHSLALFSSAAVLLKHQLSNNSSRVQDASHVDTRCRLCTEKLCKCVLS